MRKKYPQDSSISADNLTVVLMLNGEPMLYLGPVETRQRLQQAATSRPKTTTAISAYARENTGTTVFIPLQDDTEETLDLPPNGVERRVNPDRRAQSNENSLVDTRAGKDRRKTRRPSINISI